MAIPYLTNVDLNKNQILNLLLQKLAGDHGSPEEAIIWWDTVAHTLKVHDGTTIVDVLASGGGGGDADTLEGEAGAYYLDRDNHTGDQLAATISDFATAVAANIPSTYATDAEVTAAINAVVDAAPGTLDTLNELAAALGDDPNYATTITTALGTKSDKYSTNVGDNASTSIVITHNLGTRDVVVQVHRATTPWDSVYCDVERTTTNTVTLKFAVAPTTNQYRVSIVEG
jgi:hypothetical protein